jgi:hypothetical protein
VRKFLPVVLSGAVAVSFSTLAFAQSSATTTTDEKDNIHYNIHQRGEQNTSQYGSGNQSSQVLGSDNQTSQAQQQGAGNTSTTTTQSGTQNQSAVGTGNQQSQQMGSGHTSSQDSTWSEKNAQNRQSGDASASAGASADDDDKRKNKKEHANKGWHKGWDDPASSGSTKY